MVSREHEDRLAASPGSLDFEPSVMEFPRTGSSAMARPSFAMAGKVQEDKPVTFSGESYYLDESPEILERGDQQQFESNGIISVPDEIQDSFSFEPGNSPQNSKKFNTNFAAEQANGPPLGPSPQSLPNAGRTSRQTGRNSNQQQMASVYAHNSISDDVDRPSGPSRRRHDSVQIGLRVNDDQEDSALENLSSAIDLSADSIDSRAHVSVRKQPSQAVSPISPYDPQRVSMLNGQSNANISTTDNMMRELIEGQRKGSHLSKWVADIISPDGVDLEMDALGS